MRYTTNRTYHATHRKNNREPERSIDFSLAAAVGILALTFAKGLFWGYSIKKWMDR